MKPLGWRCCGRLMYTARSERDEEGTPVHVRRCRDCGRSIETEERILREGVFHLRADSARARNRRYNAYDPRTCSVCAAVYLNGRYAGHIVAKRHQRALARRRRTPERLAGHREASRRYRERLRQDRAA